MVLCWCNVQNILIELLVSKTGVFFNVEAHQLLYSFFKCSFFAFNQEKTNQIKDTKAILRLSIVS